MSSARTKDSVKAPILQACAIPYRYRKGRLQLCIITSVKKRNWILPKGIIDPGETPEETALKEAQEEAGLVGRIASAAIGQYEYAKWNRRLQVSVFLMQVEQTHEHWPEKEFRTRCWLPAEKAIDKLAKPELKAIVRKALQHITPELG